MDAFLVPRSVAPATREARLAAHAEAEAARGAEASRIGLSWPPPTGKRPARRPTDQEVYERALYNHIRLGTLPIDLTSHLKPPAWRKGDPILGPRGTMEAAMRVADEASAVPKAEPAAPPEVPLGGAETPDGGEAEQAEVAEALPGGAETPDGAEGEPSKKVARKYYSIDPIAKDWFLDFCAYQKARYGWSLAHCLRYAQTIAPSVFGNVHKDAPSKWKPTPTVETRGRPPKIPPFALTKGAEVVQSVAWWAGGALRQYKKRGS